MKTPITSKANGFSIIELIAALGILSALASLTITQLNSYFKHLELNEIFTHTNEVAARCLNDLRGNSSKKETKAIVDAALLDKNFFEISGSHANCHYFELKPKSSGGVNDLRLGFGIYKGRITKFAISNSESMNTDCARWAGNSYCIKKASSTDTSGFDKYFNHMEKVRKARIDCESTFETKLASESKFKRWDNSSDSECPLDIKENSETSYITSKCTSQGCSKTAYIFEGKFVGYSEADYTASTSAACATTLKTYLDGLSETAEPEQKDNIANCGGKTFYICNRRSQPTLRDYEACKIKQAVTTCEVALSKLWKGTDSEIVVPGQGLPPCGKTYYRCKNAIYDSQDASPCAQEPKEP